MTGIWLVSYVVLWLLVLGGAAVVLLLAREIETLHARLEAVERHKKPARSGEDGAPDGPRVPAIGLIHEHVARIAVGAPARAACRWR
ncbi:MAG: hypothetical protein RMK99_03100 [Anaerolineales bacterium]|nr:hypothetical protein [Anaerolineales bacterium]